MVSGRPHGRNRIWAACLALILAGGCSASLAAAPARAGFEVADYFHLRRITELTLSADGRRLAYVAETASLAGGEERRAFVQGTEAGAAPKPLDALADAHDLAWTAWGEIAFLSDRAGASQLFSYDPASGRIRQWTHATDPVVEFRLAPDGYGLAYVTRATPAPGASLYDRMRSGESGILIDPATTSSHDFLNPDWNALVRPSPAVLWVAADAAAAARAPIPGEPLGEDETFFWSPDSRSLSVTFVATDIPASLQRDLRTSVGVLDVAAGRFRVLAAAPASAVGGAPTGFSGGEWLPDGRSVLIRQARLTDPWVSEAFCRWAIVDLARGLPTDSAAWHPIEIYPRGLAFHPRGRDDIEVENTVAGVRSLFEIDGRSSRLAAVTRGLDGSSSLFRFSADATMVAFVNESLTRPPEIYFARDGALATPLTSLNREIARRIDFHAREVNWKSTDGVTIRGWLLEPAGSRPPWPLVVQVHGGPAFPFPNAFAPYFSYWAYPLEAYASHGIAVFMPNYRGTHTYGREVASGGGRLPGDDIVTGVRSLVDAGVADSRRLGISGHSHGAYLGPLVMTRCHVFRAASFAEGVANSVVMYDLMSEQANLEIHDPLFGASLYDAPQRYLDDSPELHFAGVSTASLFEAGARTSALFMLGYPKAARRFGMPAEFVVYPRTAHNLTIPRLQQEAADRNLDWFEFWLRDYRDPDPSKVIQYARWRRLSDTWKAAPNITAAFSGCAAGASSTPTG